MKILVATKNGQGKRDNDFNFCNEKEIVRFGMLECDGENVDGNCGCRRSLCGVDTSKGTTTMTVIDDKNMTRDILCLKLLNALKKDGWIRGEPSPENIRVINFDADELLRIAKRFKVGDVIERRAKFQKRT